MEEAFFTALLKTSWSAISNWAGKLIRKKELPLDELKKRTQVLFVDDETYDNLFSAIRQAGWNVRHVNDVTNLDSEDVKQSDVIFMDYKGVGAALSPTEEGIGLLKSLKKKYPQKYLIFISGYAGLIPGHEVHGMADGWIPKNADPYVYVDHIEAAAKVVYGK